MPGDRVTRFDADLFEAAADEGRRENRSARQQLEHWARVGRELCSHDAAAHRRITAAARGKLPLSALCSGAERRAANAELNVAIREQAASEAFGRSVLHAGVRAVALDEDDKLVEFLPDGRKRPLENTGEAQVPE